MLHQKGKEKIIMLDGILDVISSFFVSIVFFFDGLFH